MILPGLSPRFQGASHQIIAKPPKMLSSAKKRICPSVSNNSCWNILRQPAGDAKGKPPSMTSTRAMASQIVSLVKIYFLAGATAPPPPRNTLKNSDDEGSSTMTSLLLLKLALYASRLR